jgi:hypothetical protein
MINISQLTVLRYLQASGKDTSERGGPGWAKMVRKHSGTRPSDLTRAPYTMAPGKGVN